MMCSPYILLVVMLVMFLFYINRPTPKPTAFDARGTPRKKYSIKAKIILWIIGLILFFKLDGFVWGYLYFPSVTILSVMAMLGCLVVFLVNYITSWSGKRSFWTPTTIVTVLIFVSVQPYFPSGGSTYILGNYCRVKNTVDVERINKWAKDYEFSAEQKDRYEKEILSGLKATPILITGAEIPDCLNHRGFIWITLDPVNRSVHCRSPGGFCARSGLVIGPDAEKVRDNWQLSTDNGEKLCLKVAPDAYVWWGMPNE